MILHQFYLSCLAHASYLVGEKARVLMGSNLLDGTIYVEIWDGQHLLERQILDGGGVRILELPVTEALKGGFTVRWFGARTRTATSGRAPSSQSSTC